MNIYLKYSLIGILVLGALCSAVFFIKYDSKSAITHETSKPFVSSMERKTVAVGKVIPDDEIEIQPQISRIVEKVKQVKASEYV